MRRRGQWGLLGGSSNLNMGNPRTKPSKLANLARSSRGAFDKKGSRQQNEATKRFDSVSRLAALSSGIASQTLSNTPPTIPRVEPVSIPSKVDLQPNVLEPANVQAFTDPLADHLLAQPSPFANSLFHFWVTPQDVANSLLRLYANPYLLTVSNEDQLQKAFSTKSPDDIVQNARLHNKGIHLH